MNPVLPDYGGRCIANLVPALLGKSDASWLPESTRSARGVVLLVIDGLGSAEIERHSELLGTVASLPGEPITSVLPATTASALTSLSTGLAPARHGLTGYRMLVEAGVLNVLRWHVRDGSPPDPTAVQPQPAFGGAAVPCVTKSEFRHSGFSKAHLAGADFVGWQTPAVLVEQCRRLALEGRPLVFAYYPGLDGVAHEFGLHDPCYERELRAVDVLVTELVDALPADIEIVITADHGQVHLDDGDWVELGDLGALVETQAGDARFRSLYAREGHSEELANRARERYADIAWVLTRRELLDAQWLGPTLRRPVGGRVGDVVLAPHAPVGFVDPSIPFERRLRSAHGAPTAAEMLVPLITARGRGPA